MTPKNKKHLEHAKAIIPWATQTNAKRLNPDWQGMPPFIKRAKGCRMWDLDDREYIDYRCSLGPIILGYQYKAVDEAVRAQMQNGVLFSMASPIELNAAQAIIENVPWIERIRFMKTGADACTACTRLARSYTGRDHILTSGYHGYHDWFALNWSNSGVPEALRQFVHEIPYGDVEAVDHAFDSYGDQLAAVIVEPYDWNETIGKEYLQRLRQRCDASGTLLIFDEVLTGFRLGRGGAQEYFGITPDLAAYAKAIANGYPVSAFAGKKEYMQTLEKTIITITHGGETLSLAACEATMKIIRDEPVHDHINAMGKRLRDGFAEIIKEAGVPAHAGGLDPAPFIIFDDQDENRNIEWQNKLFSKLYQKGIFANHRWFISYSHQPADIDETLEKMRYAFREILLS
ncbi:MAG: aminotransferase class III-fold pyridoxal phosphate-dependent enzyme [Actinobacteria bacterium]|nr:aminotransferase class III-fold pyridoxal phosphate-dependent enzyme [Actinomycetota bacterium]